MLRQTLCRWLERKPVRPVMTRAGRTSTTSATKAAAASAPSASPGYRSGDSDLLNAAAALDVVDDVPIEPFGRPVRTANASTAAAAATARNASAQEMLARLKSKYDLTSPGASAGAAEQEADTHRKAPASSRRVMSTLRRPHAPPTSPTDAAGGATATHAGEEGGEEEDVVDVEALSSQSADAAGQSGDAADEVDADGVSSGVENNDNGTAEEAEGKDSTNAASATAAKSADAYRFLLNHIDAEIAALQRRHTSVTTRRQSVQTRQTQRIKELFEVIEAPWTLLPPEMQPALPSTGVDVYIKEQQLARQQRQGSSVPEGQDKMYVLALHKNYKSLPAGRKRFYEEAAQFNAAVREEMKYQLTRGCARFEAFLDRVKECTMAMAREGQVPELPSGHTHQQHQRFYSQRAAAAQRPQRPSPAAATAAAPTADGSEEAKDAAGDAAATSGDAPTAGKGGQRASQRIKAAAKAAKKGRAAPKKAAGNSSTSGGKAKARTAAPPKTASNKPKSAAKPAKSGGGKKTASGASRSIPLPNLNQLALKKIKQLAAPAAKKTKVAKPAKAKTSAAGGGKKKKK